MRVVYLLLCDNCVTESTDYSWSCSSFCVFTSTNYYKTVCMWKDVLCCVGGCFMWESGPCAMWEDVYDGGPCVVWEDVLCCVGGCVLWRVDHVLCGRMCSVGGWTIHCMLDHACTYCGGFVQSNNTGVVSRHSVNVLWRYCIFACMTAAIWWMPRIFSVGMSVNILLTIRLDIAVY